MSSPLSRRTKQRDAIFALLSTSPAFYSANDVFENLNRSTTPVGLSTVYRTLNVMVEAHEVDVVLLQDGQALYRLCGSQQHHHHLRCTQCGIAIEVTGEKIEEFAQEIARKFQFQNVTHSIELAGICSECTQRT
ncbi:MAG: transcriptional repressor [Actinobacteria bacterium]|uniref:Unannotated protein n=1 Tax=freshwater metagenome TaxID=449393 RepID=A0A6J5YMP9_9ZZZZ|nr:transcriptional repressor [Actinomycetota bacterium]